MKAQHSRRGQKGSAIVEGALAICMVITSTSLAALLLINCGCLMFFKMKLTHVNYQAAAYAAAHGGDSALQEETADFVKTMMSQMGLAPNNLMVAVRQTRVEENPAVIVTVTNDFPIFGVTSKIAICDSEVVSW
jgi:hypothetical protein